MYRVTLEEMEKIAPDRKEMIQEEPYRTEYDLWIRWIKEEMPKAEALASEITKAFAGVQLEDGIGLLEAEGISYYKSDSVLKALRKQDERKDWQRIPAITLAEKASALSFFDTKGFFFHLPAYLVAEVRGDIGDYVILRLMNPNIGESDWAQLLNSQQRKAVIAVLNFFAKCPAFLSEKEVIEEAIKGLTRGQ